MQAGGDAAKITAGWGVKVELAFSMGIGRIVEPVQRARETQSRLSSCFPEPLTIYGAPGAALSYPEPMSSHPGSRDIDIPSHGSI
jgi:hypothetical protein